LLKLQPKTPPLPSSLSWGTTELGIKSMVNF